ncbi:MAG TPA: hypothetical protein P5102_09285 [Candidatus Competibacteraceae bacterium]|nr:hypothetical protein [Candidatus Competibacteraceae bacterium]HSA45525.1 hypothetical protein [Candidatus Competibacteraceae bacterium]
MDEWQRRQYEQQYEQQRERKDRLLRQEEDRQRQETRQREVEADRRWQDEDWLRRRIQALKGAKAFWKRLGLGSKTGPAGGRRR